MAKITISEAARRWNVSRRTIQRKIQDGTVSCTAGRNNAKELDIAELVRVFGEPEAATMHSDTHSAAPTLSQSNVTALIEQLKAENARLQRENERLAGQVDKLIEQLGQREHFEQKLLEHQTKKRRWWNR